MKNQFWELTSISADLMCTHISEITEVRKCTVQIVKNGEGFKRCKDRN